MSILKLFFRTSFNQLYEVTLLQTTVKIFLPVKRKNGKTANDNTFSLKTNFSIQNNNNSGPIHAYEFFVLPNPSVCMIELMKRQVDCSVFKEMDSKKHRYKYFQNFLTRRTGQ